MKLAVVADIHGNLPALDAVLASLPSVDAVLCCGDIVGYYPYVDEVCERVRSLGCHTVRGNHDAYVTGALRADPARAEAYALAWTQSRLAETHRRWLAALPVEIRFRFDGAAVVVRHASPWDEETYLYPNSPLLDEVELAEGEVLFLGHTHRPLVRATGAGVVVNPGSVGQPRDWDPRASYVLFDTAARVAEHRRVEYPVRQLQAELRARGWDERTIAILNRGR